MFVTCLLGVVLCVGIVNTAEGPLMSTEGQETKNPPVSTELLKPTEGSTPMNLSSPDLQSGPSLATSTISPSSSQIQHKPLAQAQVQESYETLSVKVRCVSDEECPRSQRCVGRSCEDPCLNEHICGPNAVCLTRNHVATCACRPGTDGDPFEGCFFTGNRPECYYDTDCQQEKACINRRCVDPCATQGQCGEYAECLVRNHVSYCVCRKGYTGNPHVRCEVGTPNVPCTSSWPPNTGKKKFYLVLTVKLEWHGAYMYCLKNNSRLARIENGEENAIVKKMLDELAIKHIAAIDREFWVGGGDHAEEGQWMWLSTGEPVSGFTFWNVGNPNNWGNEDCLSFYEQDPSLGYKWNDSICDKKFNFVCEYY